jgi:hypothetical protein
MDSPSYNFQRAVNSMSNKILFDPSWYSSPNFGGLITTSFPALGNGQAALIELPDNCRGVLVKLTEKFNMFMFEPYGPHEEGSGRITFNGPKEIKNIFDIFLSENDIENIWDGLTSHIANIVTWAIEEK